jgi:hypothetical protein
MLGKIAKAMMDEGKKMHGVFFLLEMQNMGLISGPSA